MKVTYDKEAEALYIKLFDAEHGKCEELVLDEVILNKTPLGQIYGIEVLQVEEIEMIGGKK